LIAIFVVAFCTALLFVPLARWYSLRIGKIASPRLDRWHSRPTAVLGGVSIFFAFLVGFSVNFILNTEFTPRWGILLGAILAFGLGLYDDFRRLSPPAKLIGQILIAAIVISLGFRTDFFSPRIADPFLALLLNIILTFIWLVGITNAINLLDNMDGLASGIALITVLILGYFFWQSGDEGLLSISLAIAGSVLGFLIFNFPPAYIFMGDSGSLFLGFTLAVLAIARQPQASNVFAVIGVPTLLFLLPILDTVLVTFTRLLRGQSPAQGGRDHTSHRLIAFGLTERQAVLALYSVALLSGLLAATIESINYWLSLALGPLVIVILTILTAYLGGLRLFLPVTENRIRPPLTRIMLELTFRRRFLEIGLDFVLICIAYYLAFLTHVGLVISEAQLENFLESLPLAMAGAYLSFYILGVYRGVWRYIDFSDLLRYFQAALACVIIMAATGSLLAEIFPFMDIRLALWGQNGISPIIYLLFGIFLFFGLAASRSSFRILGFVQSKWGEDASLRVLIYPADDAGESVLRWLNYQNQGSYLPSGFLDDDPFMLGRMIHGIEVLGGVDHLDEILTQKKIQGLILAKREVDSITKEQILAQCKRHNCWVRQLNVNFELLE
jgi:UDP-GlcNAc:undecaprenyl-phosphate GlcNAc-1-phosphate transferase